MLNAFTDLPLTHSLTMPFHILVAAGLGLILQAQPNFASLRRLYLLSPQDRTWLYIASFPSIRQLCRVCIVQLLESTDDLVDLQLPMVLAGALERIIEAASRQSGTSGLRKLVLVQSAYGQNPEEIFTLLPKAEFERILIGGLEYFDTLYEISIPFHFLTQELVLTLSRLENLGALTVTVPTYEGVPGIPVFRGQVEGMMQIAFSQGGFSTLSQLEVCYTD